MIMVSYNVRYRKKRDWKIIYCKNDNKTQTVKHSNTIIRSSHLKYYR